MTVVETRELTTQRGKKEGKNPEFQKQAQLPTVEVPGGGIKGKGSS